MAEIKRDIRRTRKQGDSVVLTVTDFLELGKTYELREEGGKVCIREVEIIVKEE